MKKKSIQFLCICTLLVFSVSSVYACTSFAVYTDRPYYGMNFDYDLSRDVKFCVDTYGNQKIFYMKLEWERNFVNIAAVNTHGLFCNLQMVFPQVPAEVSVDPGEMRIGDLFEVSAATLKSCQGVTDVMSDLKIVMDTVSLHSLYADVYGDAMVVEVGQQDNLITKIDNNFIVMTNFPINEFADTPYQDVYGGGSDRYKTAYKYLIEHEDTFNLEDGFSLLKRAVNHGQSAGTRCSMVFDPVNNDVYITLEGTFEKIWKLSLENETIEPFRGFGQYYVLDIGDGILGSELKALEIKPNPEIEIKPVIPLKYIVVGLMLITAIVLIGIKRKKEKGKK
ncbi:MAG: hypothetical protein PVF58_13140 [Candidatus Methanofastidiosia archaeon]